MAGREPPPAVADLAAARSIVAAAERDEFLQTRAAVREIAAEYFAVEPEGVHFLWDAGGDWVAGAGQRLRYSLEWTSGFFALALANAISIPLALESVREDVAVEELAAQFLEPEDAWQVRVARGAERSAAFFRHWTRAEVASGRPGHRVVSFVPHPGLAGALELPGEDWTLVPFGAPSEFPDSRAA